jgi:deoxyribonucleoside regulator
VSQFEALVRASRLYYELGETQERIAALLGVTRPQVSRLLKQARAEGIVEIRIVDRTTEASPAADELTRRFGLRAVHLAPTLAGPDDLTRRSIGRLAAQVLRSAVRDGSLVGVADGASVSATADALADAASPVAATVVPLCGGYWFGGPTREPFRRIADAMGATAQGLLAPGLVDDAATKASLYAHAGIQAVLALWARLDVAVFGIGGRGWTEASLGAEAVRDLEAHAAVGEILIAPFDAGGKFVGKALRDRVIAFDARELSRVPVTIGVAGGPAKVVPILGALRSGAVNTLVTDVVTAQSVVAAADAT